MLDKWECVRTAWTSFLRTYCHPPGPSAAHLLCTSSGLLRPPPPSPIQRLFSATPRGGTIAPEDGPATGSPHPGTRPAHGPTRHAVPSISLCAAGAAWSAYLFPVLLCGQIAVCGFSSALYLSQQKGKPLMTGAEKHVGHCTLPFCFRSACSCRQSLSEEGKAKFSARPLDAAIGRVLQERR